MMTTSINTMDETFASSFSCHAQEATLEIGRLEEELHRSSVTLQELNDENSNLTNDLWDLIAENEELTQAFDDLYKVSQRLKQRNKTQRQRLEELESELFQTKDELQHSKRHLGTQTTEKQLLEELVKTLTEERDRAHEHNVHLSDENKRLRDELKQKDKRTIFRNELTSLKNNERTNEAASSDSFSTIADDAESFVSAASSRTTATERMSDLFKSMSNIMAATSASSRRMSFGYHDHGERRADAEEEDDDTSLLFPGESSNEQPQRRRMTLAVTTPTSGSSVSSVLSASTANDSVASQSDKPPPPFVSSHNPYMKDEYDDDDDDDDEEDDNEKEVTAINTLKRNDTSFRTVGSLDCSSVSFYSAKDQEQQKDDSSHRGHSKSVNSCSNSKADALCGGSLLLENAEKDGNVTKQLCPSSNNSHRRPKRSSLGARIKPRQRSSLSSTTSSACAAEYLFQQFGASANL